ncbi:MAG: hypothetical protein WB014_13605 [Methanosarcina sp.]
MAKTTRDDFNETTKRVIARRVNYICSIPHCPLFTQKPHPADTEDVLNLGTAAHITAASEGGPRFDPTMTPEQRKSADNGIWLCKKCADEIDLASEVYTVELLRYWKRLAEEKTARISSCNGDTITQIINDVNIAMDKLGQFLEYEATIPDPYLQSKISDFNTRVDEGMKHSSEIRAKYIREVSPYVGNAVIKCRSILGDSDEIIKEMDDRHLPESVAVNKLGREEMHYTLQKLKTKLSMW